MRSPLAYILLLVPGLALAQGSTFSYRAEDLSTKPGLILITPGYTTLIELFAPVEEQFAGNGNLVDIKTSGNLVVLFAKAKTGETDLILRSKGQTMLFRIKATEKGEPRRYMVLEGPTAYTLSPTEPTLLPTATRAQKAGLGLAGQARILGGNLEVLLEVRAANLGLTRLLLERTEVQGPKGPASFTVSRQGKDTLPPLEATRLRVLVFGQNRATISIPVQTGGKTYTVRVVAAAGGDAWEPVSLDVLE